MSGRFAIRGGMCFVDWQSEAEDFPEDDEGSLFI